MKINHKIIVALAGAIFLVTLGIAVSFLTFRQIEETARTRTRTMTIIKRAGDLTAAMVNAETGQRGFALTDDELFLQPYLAVRDKVGPELNDLRQLTLIDSARQHLDAVHPLMLAKLAFIAHIIELRRNHDVLGVTDAMKNGIGKRLMDSIRTEMAAYIQIEELALAESEAKFQSKIHRMFFIIIAVSICALLCALLFARLAQRENNHRLKTLVHLETQRLLAIQELTSARLQQSNATLQVSESRLTHSLKENGDLKAALDEHAIVAITDQQGRITYVNDKFCAISQYSKEELLGQDHRIINSGYHPKTFFAGIWTTITGGRVWHGEIKNRAKGGSHYWMDTTIVPFLGENGKPRQYVAIRADITERKRVEEEIQQLNTELEQRVIDRTAELASANKELEAFSYTVSHDLRAPLRAIDGFSQAVLEDFGPTLPVQGQHYLQTIRQSAQQMGSLIDDLLAFSRLNQQELNRQKINTTALVRAALELLGSPWPERKVEIHLGALPSSYGDPALLKQVWVNLLSNALKYSRKRELAEITVGCKMLDGTETFFIQDNGTGFDLRYADKLFGVFQRLHRAEDFDGTGVGLAIVQRILHRHGGRIWADAAVDRGATFYFTLNTGKTS